MLGARPQLLVVPVLIATVAALVQHRAEPSQIGLADSGSDSGFAHPPFAESHNTCRFGQCVTLPAGKSVVIAVMNPSHHSQRVEISPGLAAGSSIEPPRLTNSGLNQIEPVSGSRSQGFQRVRSDTPPPPRRRFLVHSGEAFDDARFYRRLDCRLVASDECCCIYAVPGIREPGQRDLTHWLRCYRRQSHAVARVLGSYADDVDGNGRFTILLIPRPTQPGPLAYVRPIDFVSAESELSNHADMLYLSADLPPTADVATLLTHEYAHAVCSSLRPETREHDWLSEGIAHCVEQATEVSPTNFDHRVARFQEHPQNYPLIVRDYFGTKRFRDHGARGATVSFLASSVDRHGTRLLSRISRSRRVGLLNLTGATGQTRECIYRGWAQSLLEALQTPRVLGRFVSIGPRPIPLSRELRTQLVLAPTSIAFIEVPAERVADKISVAGENPSHQPIVNMGEGAADLAMTAVRDGSTVHVELPSITTSDRCVVSAEFHGPARTVPLGVRHVTGGGSALPVVFSVPTRLRTGEIVVKAFNEDRSGFVRTARVVLPPVTQFTSRPIDGNSDPIAGRRASAEHSRSGRGYGSTTH